MSIRFTNLDALGTHVSVPIPTDEAGLLGRECPIEECLRYFKIEPGTGLTGPNLQCHCPYCGHAGDPNAFWTQEQVDYATSVALRQFSDAFREDLKQLEFSHKPRGHFGIGFSMTVESGPLPTIRHYLEKKVETDVVCMNCTLHYSVFGLFAYCPDCGIHNSLQVLERNLVLVEKQIALAGSIENDELARHLVEDGLENCVSAFDGFGRETCRVRATKSSDATRAGNLSFQNLERAADALETLFSIDLFAAIAPNAWELAKRGFAKRHLLAHRSGIVDERYLQTTRDPKAIVGRRVLVTADEVSDIAGVVAALGRALINILPAP